VSSVAGSADFTHVLGLMHCVVVVHCVQVPLSTLPLAVSHHGVAPAHPVAWPSSAHEHGRHPAGEPGPVQIAGSEALVVMQSLTSLLHSCVTVHAVPLVLIVP
jgi:hypothetical protein